MEHRAGIGDDPRARAARRSYRRAWRPGAALLLVGLAVFAAVEILAGGSSTRAVAAEDWARAWASGDYGKLYADLEPRSQASLTAARIASIERHDAAIATLAQVSVGSASPASAGRVVVAVTIRTRIFGTLHERFTLTLSTAAGPPRVLWNEAASFPGLAGGEQLRRVDSAPVRGALLTRDGTPLSGLAPASNLIGDVGPATGSLLEQSVAAGFPAATPVGLDGLELLFQRELGGTPGGSLYAGTRLLAGAPPRPGVDVRTSISPTLQTLAVNELGSSRLGDIVVMEPSTGEVLAAAGSPLSELQPPGSTFKIITLTGVLEAHLSTPSTRYADATSTELDGFTLHNSDDESCGGTLANAFAVSCNSVFAPLGARLGASRLVAAAEAFGFNAPSPVSIAATSTIPLRSLSDRLQVGESAIGQGQVLASPLQMARVAATIALVGRRPRPSFAIVAPRLFPRVIPVGVARTVRALMRGVVSYGTGIAAQIPGVVVAGKTGTAQVVTPPPCVVGATGATGTTGTTGATGATGASGASAASVRSDAGTDAAANAASGRARAESPRATTAAAPSGTGGASAPGAGSGATAQTGASGATASSGSGGAGGPAGASGAGSVTGASGVSGASGASGAGGGSGGTGATTATGATGVTGATGCPAFDSNPYDTDAWFVAFAPEIHPRVVVSVLLPHDGAGGTTAAPLARVMLEQALALTG